MSVLEQSPALQTALRGEMTPKFLATRSPDGTPNVVPVVSLQPADDQPDVLFFGNFLLRKSIGNLEQDPRVGVMVITPELEGWVLTGDFLEFQRTGSYVDRQMSGSLLRYNAYTGIRNAGLIRIREIRGNFRISRMRVLADYLLAMLVPAPTADADSRMTRLPLPVREVFGRMTAVKVLAWIDADGYPLVIPSLSLRPAGPAGLACFRPSAAMELPPDGVAAASNILTLDAISYQAKGHWESRRPGGVLLVDEVYAGGPPLPGGRVA
jgi:hypothetical protein